MPNTGPYSIILFLGLPVLGYLLGSIPWGVVLTRLFTPIDIRSQGSGNIGATNVSRVAGSTLGLLTFIGDVLKGALPVFLALFTSENKTWSNDIYFSIVALAAFAGHLYPLFMKFKGGGKGVATAAGCVVVLAPIACLSALLVFVLFFFVSQRISLGSLSAAVGLPVAVWFTTQSVELTCTAAIMSVFIFIRHTDNIKRLISGSEPKFREKNADVKNPTSTR